MKLCDFLLYQKMKWKKGNYSYQIKKDVQLQYATLMKTIVLPSAKKVKTYQNDKDTITDNEIKKSEIEQMLDTGCQTD